MKVAKLIEDPCSCGRGPIDRYPQQRYVVYAPVKKK